MFDSNVWQRVVNPDRFPGDAAKLRSASVIQQALKTGRICGFISETVITIEAIPKRQRGTYLRDSFEAAIKFEWLEEASGVTRGTVIIGGTSGAHPGIKPVLSDRLNAAFELGIKIIPSPRMGMIRPEIDNWHARLMPLTQEQDQDIWALLDRIDQVSREIEARGVGRSVLHSIASRIQQRGGIVDGAWYDGLESPNDESEAVEIQRAFAEWADGDSIALHIAYGLEIFCTEDVGKSAGASILAPVNRRWLEATYGVRFTDMEELARIVAVSPTE